MKKQNGFTLAEVLITIGILGVIASLTLPALMNDIGKQQWVNGLKAGQNVLTNGFAQMMASEGVDNIRDTALWADCLASESVVVAQTSCITKNMKQYFSISKIEDIPSTGTGDTIDIMGNDYSSALGETIAYTLSNGTIMYMNYMGAYSDKSRSECDAIKENGGSMCGIAGNIYLDANGAKGPNTIGKDIYRFFLAPNGRIYPMGGLDASLYDDTSHPKWETVCSGNPVNSQCTNGKSFALTGRVIAEGYKITY